MMQLVFPSHRAPFPVCNIPGILILASVIQDKKKVVCKRNIGMSIELIGYRQLCVDKAIGL